MATIKRFEDIEIWKEARALAKRCYALSRVASEHQDYDLGKALPKTSGSVMDNIAEGFARQGNREFTQFLSIAQASCSEVKSQLYRLTDRDYFTDNLTQDIEHCEKLMNMINAFQSYLKKSELKGYKYMEEKSTYVKKIQQSLD